MRPLFVSLLLVTAAMGQTQYRIPVWPVGTSSYIWAQLDPGIKPGGAIARSVQLPIVGHTGLMPGSSCAQMCEDVPNGHTGMRYCVCPIAAVTSSRLTNNGRISLGSDTQHERAT